MARTPVAFRTVFEAACRVASGSVPAAGSTEETNKLYDFNRSYAIGYKQGGAEGWSDARVGAPVTPVSRLISFATIGDGRLWEVWNEDPRGNDAAYRLGFTEDSDGILLNDVVSTCWMSWIPETVKFGNTAWEAAAHTYAVGDKVVYTTNGHCYRCLVAHSTTTGSVFTDDLAAGNWVIVPVLAILEEFVVAHMQGGYLIRQQEPATGYGMQKAALAAVEDYALAEARNRLKGDKPSSGSVASTSASIGTQNGTQSLTAGVTSGTVTFPNEFISAPSRIFCQIEIPATGGTVDATASLIWPTIHTRSITGFKYELSGTPGDANHKLHWKAER